MERRWEVEVACVGKGGGMRVGGVMFGGVWDVLRGL